MNWKFVEQIWDNMFKKLEREGKKLVDAGVLKSTDFEAYMKSKGTVPDGKIVEIGLPTYCNFDSLLYSAKSKSPGLLLGEFPCNFVSTSMKRYFGVHNMSALIYKESTRILLDEIWQICLPVKQMTG